MYLKCSRKSDIVTFYYDKLWPSAVVQIKETFYHGVVSDLS